MASTMKAWHFTSPGTISKILSLADNTPKPADEEIKNGRILIKVARACINPADYKVPELGQVSRALVSYPKTPGMDLCGRVVAVADDVHDVEVGRLVIARVNPLGSRGALSEYAIAELDGYGTIADDIDLDQAAGAPTAALTAFQTIAPYVKKGDKVFINGGSGGVGTFGIQIAKILGCHCNVIEELESRGEQFAVVVDNVGDSPANLFNECHKFLVPDKNGGYVFVGGHLASWMEEGRLKTVVDSVFEFDQAHEAFEHLKRDHVLEK
ncbi:unnamed protein product [Parascedosporium putredinis]|uniref:Enoyl reductase (ER) domain-containing protein n=1 Tax=Parascedosporium putredinis TaxID=1442378 RepID=A0A9P1MA86_9PEZI|nr:unnamed protein product [Parascedosporium putredinis]CAI7996164.1 unnamed protein product [Parascedosporium putredinis]